MKNFIQGTLICCLALFVLNSCQETSHDDPTVPQDVILKLQEMGFNPDGIEIVPEGYRIERDIIIRPEDLKQEHLGHIDVKGNLKQYRTTNLVSTGAGRTISVYIPQEGSGGKGKKTKGFNENYVNALDDALGRFNAENLTLNFERVTSTSAADIVFTRLGKGDERRGILGSAGFPTGGNPYGEVKMSGIIDTRYNWSTEAIATVMAHELGHCIGFRHTDYFDRSLSCGGSTSNEGQAGVGAIHIPGTPTGMSNESWMLSCTGGGDRQFNNHDQIALDELYGPN